MSTIILAASVVKQILSPNMLHTNSLKIAEIVLQLNNDIINIPQSNLIAKFIISLVDELPITPDKVKMRVIYPPSSTSVDICGLLFGSDPSESYLKNGVKGIVLQFEGVKKSDELSIHEYLQSAKKY